MITLSGASGTGTFRLDDFQLIGTVSAAASAPSVSSTAASSITATSATLGGNVTADGGDTVTNRGVVYKTSSGVTISDNKTPIGTGTGAFSNTVSSLSVNTRYYFRAYAQNSAGTSLGSESNFWTLANVPSAPTVANPTSSSLDITVNANGNPSSTEFAIQRTSDNQYLQSDGSWGASAVWATAATWGTKTATGLSPSTTYYFRVKARNGVNVETAFGSTASGTTSASGCAERWTCLDNLGAPVYTYYLGDYLAYIYYYEINTDTFGWTSDYGLGKTTDGSGWTWRSAEYDSNNGTNWKWKSKASEHQFTSVGNWYYAGRFVNGGCTYYADKTWQSTSAKALDATNYFTVSALTDPTVGTVTATASAITLNWTKWNNKNVMVVRSTDSSFTAPTQGTAYTAGSSTIGGDLVIYNGNGTSYNDTGRTQGTIYYYKFYSVNNDYYSAGVTADATTWTLPTVSTTSATPGTPADPTQANATGNVTAEGGQSVTERGIVWNTTGAPTTANTKVAHASGGTGSFTVTLTSLTPGQTIYYRAYAINSVGTAYGSTLDFTADCFTNGPGILAASAVGLTNFTANWSAVGGASGYQLDVSTNATFGGGVGAALTNDCADVGGGTTSSYLTRIWTNNTDVVWTAYKARTDQKVNDNPSVCLRNEADSYIECTTIPNGISTLKFDVQQKFTGTGGQLTVYVNGTSKGTFDYDTTVQTAEFNTINVANVTSLVISNNTAARPAINNLVWTDYGSPSFVPGFSNLTVAATSQVVTGLTSDVEYYYRVRATNEFCISDDSETTNVTTLAGQATVVLGNNVPQVAAATVAAGTTAHILHRFQLGVTVANATLTNVSFTTAGSYAAADITKLQVWYSADDSLNTGTDTKLGSDITTGLGPGSHGITGLSQAINVGDTGYIFITADIAASPTYGKTINVAAITTGDVGFTAATKSGSTTAGGAQTIVAAEPTVHATTLLFTAVQTNQMTVSWTSGNGERRIVVVRPALATSWTPTDFVAPAGVDANYDGATDKGSGNRICYDGTGNSFTLTGLNAGTTYAVTVFEYNGTGTYVNYFVTGTPLSGSQMTACPAAPTGLFANPTNQFDFTANWTAVAGATGYRIDVSSNDLSGSSLSTNLYESFASFTLAENTDISGSLDTYTLVPGWTGSKVYSAAAGGLAKIGAASTAGELITPSLNLSGNGGAATLTYDAYSYGSDSAAAIISVSINGGSSYAIVVTNTFSGSMTTYTVELTGCTATTKIKIASRIASSCRFYLDEFKVMQGGAFSYVPGYENLFVTGTSVSVTGLQDSVTYYWRVAATGAECTGDYSTVASVTTLAGPPPKPTGLTATKGTQLAHVALSWNNDSDKETGFVIYRHTANAFGSATPLHTNAANVTTYNDTTAVIGTRYYYWIVATNALGTSSPSDPDSGFRKLPMVTGVSATDGTSTNYTTITWTDSNAGESGYSVWYYTANASGSATWLANVTADVATYNHEGTPGQQYYYWVRATNSTLATQSDLQATGEPGYRRLASVYVSATDNTDTEQVALTWTDILGETGYQVWRSETTSPNDAELLETLTAGATSYNDTDAMSGFQYYYWVIATNSSSSSASEWVPGDPGMRRLVENPVSAAVARDGREMVRATIVANSGDMDVLVLHSTVEAVTTRPTMNTAYSVGTAIGTAKVVYKGAAADFREHVVAPNTTNHYRVFSIDPNAGTKIYYSPGSIPSHSPVVTKPYQPNVVVETFSYTNVTLNSASFTNKAGGANWASGSNWVLSTDGVSSWLVLPDDSFDDRPIFSTAPSNQATLSGNRAFINLDGASRWGNATRAIPATNSGTVFVSALMAYRYEGDNEGAARWMTIAPMDGENEAFEFGKVWGGHRLFSIRQGGNNGASSYYLNPYHASTDNWYWVVMKYDFGTGTAKAKAFWKGQDIPSAEPADDEWNVTWTGMNLSKITGIRLKAGGSDTDQLGGALFDEVRVSSVWPALIGEPNIVVTPLSMDYGNVETDRTDVATFWVQNTGGDNVPLTVSSLKLGGTNPTNFSLSASSLGVINYGQSNSFTVRFMPHAVQSFSATLYVTNSSGTSPVVIPLTGIGTVSSGTNLPAVDGYQVGVTNQVTDGMVTSGVFSVVVEAFHSRGIQAATYDLFNGSGVKILTNQAFESWTSANGRNYVLSNATHSGYWPATPSDAYKLRVYLTSTNGIGSTNNYVGGSGGITAPDLFFSEYIEGSSNNKFLEIYNGTASSVNLSNYKVLQYNNGSASPTYTLALSGTLAPGAVYVIGNSSQGLGVSVDLSTSSSVMTFNGNDAIALAKSGVNIDVVGPIGSSADFAKDVTKVRKSSVTAGTTTYATSEWDNYAVDTTTYLGAHTMDGAGESGTPMVFQVIDDDTAAPEITAPMVNGEIAPHSSAVGPSIPIGDVPVGGFKLDWEIQDVGSGVFAASNHYTLKRSNVVISASAVTVGANGDGKAAPLSISATVPRSSMIWGNYVLSLAGHDFDPEWVGDISSVSNVYYFVIAAPSIGVDPISLDYGTVDRNATSNRTVVVTNSGNADLVISSIGFTGTGNGYFTVASPAVPLTVTPGDSANVVVSFTPTAGGNFNVTMTLNNNSPDHPAQTVPITAVCHDPETSPPTLVDFAAVDSRLVTNEVTDHALGHTDVTLNFSLWHFKGMSPTGASYDLLDPAGNLVWTNGTFDAVTGTVIGTKTCQVFSATVPGFYPAVLGVYTARVTAVSSNGYGVTDQATYTPSTAGAGVPFVLDRFSRPDVSDDIGEGWATNNTGPTAGNIQLRDHALQFYGVGGTSGDGRLSVVRDMTGRYNPVLTNNAGTLTWAFNFFSGQANMTGLGSGKYAGLYVLGASATNFVGGTGLGYAVRICSNQVALVKFTGGLNSDTDATTIGTPANLAANSPMGIRVTLDAATGTWTLYTTNWGGTGPEAFGNPLAADDLATSNVDATYLGATSLPYVGCYWNHGSGAPGSTYGAVFDDVYAPYVMPAAPLMNFTVIDEDWRGPEHSGFNVDNRAFTVASIASGLTVTGLVADANGVYAGTSNVWTLFSNATQVASGSMTMTPNTDGAGTLATPAALSTTIPFNALNTTNYTFTFRLVSTDFDVDRPGDFLSITNTFTFTIVDTEAPTPTDVTATGDGMEMAVLTWNLNGAKGAVVLRSADSAAIAAATMLTMGTAYNQGDAGPNGTTVAYHGTNQTGAEIVVPMGSSNYFRVFGANGTIYSVDSVAPAVVPLMKYEEGEIVDQFAYTNNYIWTHDGGGTNWAYLNDQAGTGQGWNGPWTGDINKALTIEDVNLLCGDYTQFPDPYANKLQWVPNTQEATSVAITRKLATKRSGKTFIAFMMNYKVGNNDCDLSNKYIGLSLMSGATADKEEIFFGKLHGRDKDAGIEVPATGKFISNTPYYAFNAKHHDDYMIVGEWDPAIKTARMWAFYQGDITPIPQEYTNAPPIATFSNAAFNVADITGIRLAAGMTSADTNSLDHVYFDEVRVGGTWDEVLNFNYPKAMNFRAGELINGTNYVSDGQLSETNKSWPISYTLYHRTGVTNASFNIITNVASTNGLYTPAVNLLLDPADAGPTAKYRDFTNLVSTRLDTNLVTLGVYTSRVWMTAVSGKATNTLFMEGMAGATDLFFGEFGEGEGYDKYVEIYNGTGGSIDLSQYYLKVQMNPSDYEDYTQNTWSRTSYLATNTFWLDHGETIVIANGGGPSGQKADPALTNALATAGLDYLLSSNDVLNVSGDDVIGLFHVSSSDEWIDACGIAPHGGTEGRYIMRRLEDAEVPRSYPLAINTNDWDYRGWAVKPTSDRTAGYTNFLATAGEYDRNVGLGGYITFTVYDDDTLPPAMGTNNVLMVGTEAPYTSLAPTSGVVEVVLTAWNFTNAAPWGGSLITNGTVTCHPGYTNESPGLVHTNHSGTSENDMFGPYDSPNAGVVQLANIGSYFTPVETAWIQYEMELTSADDMVLSWAEVGGSAGFTSAQLSWSADGLNFHTNSAWPAWNPCQGSAWSTRYAEFKGVVTPGLSKVYIRVNLGPGYGAANGYYRMDNVQLNGYPQEFQVTDGQIAASGNKFQFRANVYDTNSGLNKAQATMKLQDTTGTRVPGKDIGDGSTTNSTLWWELDVTRADITDYVNESLSGKGLTINVKVPDADADRPNDATWLDGRIGQVRVIDDDTDRPKLTLTSMKPLSSILAQWTQMTEKISLMPTKSDAGVEAEPLKTKSGTDDPKNPNFSIVTTNGYYIIEAFAWQGQNKCWLIEVTPEADMSLTNLTFTSYMHRTNGVSNYRIDHYVDGAWKATILPATYWVNPPAFLDPNAWYTRSHGWAPGTVVLEAGKVNQIRIYGLGSSNIGARWRISDLTLWQAATDTDGVTEVTDAEFTSGSFKLTGHAWDTGSGIASTNHTDPAKRPMFSLNAPDGGVLVTNQLFAFTGEVVDGGATTKEDGAFECLLPTPVYTNVMLGGYTGEAHVWDYDNDRTSDDLRLRGDLAMYVVDNDIREPTAVGTVRVNGNEVPGTPPDRLNVAWTNQPDFIVSFDSVAVDQDPGATYSLKQRALTGIGEYRVTTDANVNSLTPSNRATRGKPYPVATTNGALANYGFEMNGQGWTLDANSSYRSLAVGGTNEVKEGTNSLRQINGGVASQTIEFRNTAGVAPIVGVSGWYRSDTVGGPTFRIEAFATNNLTTPVATRNLQPGTATTWTQFEINPPEEIGDGTVEVIKVSLIDGGGNTTYWDDIRLSVDIGANTPSMRFTAGVENQGLNPQYLFAVDADNNRAGDRLAGEAKPFYIAYDVTPPTQIRMYSAGAGATTETVDDPTTQFDLRWYTSYGGRNVGPDDPDNANHPTKLGADTDLLSPWMTYKIYFGTYNTLDVPEGDNPTSETTGFVYTNYIVNNAYRTWPSITASSKIEDQSTTLTNYSTLTNMTQTGGNVYSNRVYNLDFDQDYIVVVVGVDKAGNEGPAGIFSWATNNTIKFALTRGWKLPKASALAAFPGAPSLSDTNRLSAMGVAWTAAGPTNEWGQYTMVTKDYDMIYWDSSSFRDSSNNVWQLVGTVNSNWYADDGGQARARGDIRFYRASYKDRWRKELQIGGQTVKQRPLASEEVYAMHNVILSGGQNFVALHGVPYSNSFAAVFGDTNTFPGGTSASPGSGATVVEFYSPGANALTSEQYWLNTAGEWWRAGGIEVTHTVLTNRNFFTRGFSIHLPNPLPEAYVTTNAFDSRMYRDEEQQRIPVPAMVWSPILQVPTNDFSQTIYTGETVGRVKTCVYNLTALRLPVAAHPSQMRLLECGFVRAANYADGDLIYTINTSTKDVLSGRGIWCDNNGVWRFADKNSGVVPGGYFKPNDVIIIVSRNKVGNGSWVWTYSPTHFYTLPTRWMGN
ncbi:MAG: choice-of-anchor D domain-containing protein [Kiritimatiellia bacterium]